MSWESPKASDPAEDFPTFIIRGDNAVARRVQPAPAVAGTSDSAIIDPMTTFKRFDQGLTAWSGQVGGDYNPAMKNRLQAIGEIRARVSRLQPVGEFAADIALLLQSVQQCQEDFDPMFDTEYGAGRDVHRRLIGLLEVSTTQEAFDAGWRHLVA